MYNQPDTNTTKTSDPVNRNRNLSQDFYEDGYLEGRATERRLQEGSYIGRESNNTANAWLIGFGLTAGIGFIVGALLFLTQQNQPSTRVVPVPVPNGSQSQTNDSRQPEKTENRTTIIERTIDRTKEAVPAPQKQTSEAPEININLATPSPQQEPSSQNSPNQPESQAQE